MQSTTFHTPQQLPPTSPIPSSSPTLLPGSFISASASSTMIGDDHDPDGLGHHSSGGANASGAMPPLPTTPHRHGQQTPVRPQLGHLQTGDFTTPTGHSYAPPNSSPLASPRTPTRSSLQQEQQQQRLGMGMGVKPFLSAGNLERRKSAYKARVSVGGGGGDERIRNPFIVGGGGVSPAGSSFSLGTSSGSQAQKEFLRRQFQQKCLERAARARERAVQSKRAGTGGSVKKDASFSSDYSSDGFDEEMMGVEDNDEEEESVEEVMETELFGRLLEHFERQEKHSYRRSYAQEVGSSFDPDMEDIDEWEQHLTVDAPGVSTSQPSTPIARPKYNYRPANANVTSRSLLQVPSTPTPLPIPPNPSSSASSNSTPRSVPATPSSTQEDDEEHEIPYDLDDMTSEELEAYAREYERQAALAEFDGISKEELFGGLSDFEDEEEVGHGHGGRSGGGGDDDMDVA